jgi:cytosine/adenosine deaminase-related metal-dependent hydrolase
MGVDRIGKGAAGTVAPAAGKAVEASRPFAIGEGAAVPAVSEVGSKALEQLRAGSIDVGQYLDLKVTEATAHLTFLAPADLDAVRATLRDRLASDPALVELSGVVGRAAAAGTVPSPSSSGG